MCMIPRCGALFVVSVLLLPLVGPLCAQQRDVYWAGMSFIGDADRVSQDFHYLSTLLSERNAQGGSPLEHQLAQQLAGARLEYPLKTIADGLADLRHSAPLVMTCAFDLEQVRVEPLSDFYRISVLISAQLLVVDFETMMIASAHPIVVQLIDVAEQRPDSITLQRLVENALFDETEGKFSVFSDLVAKAEDIWPFHRPGARIQVAGVQISTEAATEAGIEATERVRLQHDLAYQFGKSLSENARIPVLPYSRSRAHQEAVVADLGQAIGSRMTAVFANGNIYSLTVPTADYQVKFRVDRLVKQVHAQTSAATSWIYGMAGAFELLDPNRERTVAVRHFKYGRSEVLSNRQQVDAGHLVHVETMWAFFGQLAGQFLEPETAWLEKHDLQPRSAAREMKTIKSYFDRCR